MSTEPGAFQRHSLRCEKSQRNANGINLNQSKQIVQRKLHYPRADDKERTVDILLYVYK